MNRAVFDKNVVVSGFLSSAGPPGRIVEWLRNGEVQAVADDRIMAEYAEVLARPAFRLPLAEVALVLAAIRTRSFWVEVTAAHMVCDLPDPDGAPFLECAQTAGVPLVTGNIRHFPKSAAKTAIVITPTQFVASHRG
ncbi:MAG: PIN domain-containing protein [Verrucomicrobia bacterium]|jgi:predicted nucleic acid-binding protein|nr:PIN domain-containing protein [Verrucomicrobiota bacterium]